MTAGSSTSTGPVRPTAPQGVPLRRLAVAWQHPESRTIQPVGLLVYDGERYLFEYVRNAQNVEDFVPFVSFPDVGRAYSSTRLFPLFSQRVMDPRRPDFVRYVRTLDLSPEATPWE